MLNRPVDHAIWPAIVGSRIARLTCINHDADEAFSGQDYFPDGMARQKYYEPAERGFEREISKRLAYWDKLRRSSAEEEA